MRPQSGLSLIEVLVAIMLAALLLRLAVPGFDAMRARRAAAGAVTTLTSDFALARSEAIKRGHSVTVCSSDNGSACLASDDWGSGWIVYVGHASVAPSGAAILRVQGPLAGIASLKATQAALTFRPTGMVHAAAGQLRVIPQGDSAATSLICISAAGRMRLAPEGSRQC